MHGWPMEIEPLEHNLVQFERIIIVTPIWVFRMCPPIRGFVQTNQEILKQKDVSVIFNHFNPWLPSGAVKEMKQYVNVVEVESRTTTLGHTFGKR